jgi:membrane protein required for colicin V production
VNVLDYAILIVLLLSILIGVVRGAIREIVNIVSWVAGFIAAQAYAVDLVPYFSDWMVDPAIRYVVAWILVFFCVVIALSVIGSLIAEAVRKLGLGALDRVVGAAIGAVRAVLVLLLLTLAAGLTTFPKTTIWKEASLTPWLETAALYVRSLLPENLAKRIQYNRTGGQKT